MQINRGRSVMACVLAAFAACGCGAASSPAGPGAVEQGDLDAVRRATAAFHDPAVAAAAGYAFTEPCESNERGVMGIHAPNLTLLRDEAIDPARPEILLYVPKDDGGLQLVGVEYVRFASVREPVTGAVAPWRSPSPWPADHALVTAPPQLFGRVFDGPMPGHSATMPWHWDLHVWLWVRNPNGVFAPYNPRLRC